jgi:hypothetical protein
VVKKHAPQALKAYEKAKERGSISANLAWLWGAAKLDPWADAADESDEWTLARMETRFVEERVDEDVDAIRAGAL